MATAETRAEYLDSPNSRAEAANGSEYPDGYGG
jgi:hypothetical protein